MKSLSLDTECLIPTDCPRSLLGILKFIPDMCARRAVDPIVVVQASGPESEARAREYFVCSGNHRTAAAHICQVKIAAHVVTTEADLAELRDGAVTECSTIAELVDSCRNAAEDGGYLSGRWQEYLKMITDSEVVGFDEETTARMSEAAMRRGARPTY